MPDNETIVERGEARTVPLRELRFDPLNPRLPETLQGRPQDELAIDLEMAFDAFIVAESLASHGYFASEPLIVIPSEEERGAWIVVEGNRRLAALLGLARPDYRSRFARPERWERIAAKSSVTLDASIPVVVAADRKDVIPVIGFRHISGILQWQPFAQARYVARLVDEDGMTFADVATTIGIDRTRVGNLYRDQAIAKQARRIGIETGNMEQSFSLLTVAMSNTRLRNHVGAPLGAQCPTDGDPLPSEKGPELREVVTWVFGDAATPPVINDSRDMTKLGNVVAHDAGLASLRAGDSLEHAVQKVKDAGDNPRQRLINRLKTGKNALEYAADDIEDYVADEEVRALVAEARAAADALVAALENA